MKEFRKIPSTKFLYEINADGVLRNVKSKKVRKWYIGTDGYKYYSFDVKCLDYQKKAQHRLLAEVFLKDFREDLTVDHINNDKLDNRLENLQMLSLEDNYKKAVTDGLMKGPDGFPIKAIGKDNSELEFKNSGEAADYILSLFPDKNRRTLLANISKYAYNNRKGMIYGYHWIRL